MEYPPWDLSSLSPEAHSLLQRSWDTAQASGCCTENCSDIAEGKGIKAKQWIPFEKQRPVIDAEQVFQIRPSVYLASEFGAASPEVFDLFRFGLVINITKGERKVPNHFSDRGIAYINYELTDQPGEDIMTHGIRQGTVDIDKAVASAKVVIVHCSAGLSRSASVVVAWLMKSENLTLAHAVEEVNCRRGRRVQINPSFWMALARWERELNGLTSGTSPSLDFSPWWVEDFGHMGFSEDSIKHALVEVGDWVNFEPAFESMLLSV